MAARKVKTVSIRYGILGNPDNARIEKALGKWMSKGYTLKSREETKGGFGTIGKTHLIFVKDE